MSCRRVLQSSRRRNGWRTRPWDTIPAGYRQCKRFAAAEPRCGVGRQFPEPPTRPQTPRLLSPAGCVTFPGPLLAPPAREFFSYALPPQGQSHQEGAQGRLPQAHEVRCRPQDSESPAPHRPPHPHPLIALPAHALIALWAKASLSPAAGDFVERVSRAPHGADRAGRAPLLSHWPAWRGEDDHRPAARAAAWHRILRSRRPRAATARTHVGDGGLFTGRANLARRGSSRCQSILSSAARACGSRLGWRCPARSLYRRVAQRTARCRACDHA
mgnify:CR=1 FL=1